MDTVGRHPVEKHWTLWGKDNITFLRAWNGKGKRQEGGIVRFGKTKIHADFAAKKKASSTAPPLVAAQHRE